MEEKDNLGEFNHYFSQYKEFLTKKEEIRKKSTEFLSNNNKMRSYFNLILQCNNSIMRTLGYQISQDEMRTVQFFSIRLTNSILSGLDELFVGMYQQALMFLRDIYEIQILLNYYLIDKTILNKFINNEKINFSKLIEKLNKHNDEEAKLKGVQAEISNSNIRGKNYKNYSSYGTHFKYESIKLYQYQGQTYPRNFFEESFFVGTLEEMIKTIPYTTLLYLSTMTSQNPIEIYELGKLLNKKMADLGLID